MSERDEERFFAMERLDECLALRKEVAVLREKLKETDKYCQRVIESIRQFLRANAYTDDMKKLVIIGSGVLVTSVAVPLLYPYLIIRVLILAGLLAKLESRKPMPREE